MRVHQEPEQEADVESGGIIISTHVRKLSAQGAIVLSIGLAGCGPHLGSYRFENARMVDRATFNAIDADNPYGGNSDLLRIEFSSESDLETKSGGSGSGLYVKADFCPFRDEYGIDALGPYYNDRSPYRLLNRRERTLPDGSIRIEGEQLHPTRDPETNRYVYTAYIVPFRAADLGTPGREAREAYDLRTESRDLCLRIDHPGYYLTPSRSQVFVIPGSAIAAALRHHPPSRSHS